jgi:hypothetical protein
VGTQTVIYTGRMILVCGFIVWGCTTCSVGAVGVHRVCARGRGEGQGGDGWTCEVAAEGWTGSAWRSGEEDCQTWKKRARSGRCSIGSGPSLRAVRRRWLS